MNEKKTEYNSRLRDDNETFFDDSVKTFALKNRFYVVEPSGETFIITVPDGDYSPREW